MLPTYSITMCESRYRGQVQRAGAEGRCRGLVQRGQVQRAGTEGRYRKVGFLQVAGRCIVSLMPNAHSSNVCHKLFTST